MQPAVCIRSATLKNGREGVTKEWLACRQEPSSTLHVQHLRIRRRLPDSRSHLFATRQRVGLGALIWIPMSGAARRCSTHRSREHQHSCRLKCGLHESIRKPVVRGGKEAAAQRRISDRACFWILFDGWPSADGIDGVCQCMGYVNACGGSIH